MYGVAEERMAKHECFIQGKAIEKAKLPRRQLPQQAWFRRGAMQCIKRDRRPIHRVKKREKEKKRKRKNERREQEGDLEKK
jgi:hypothetical protein